MSARNETSPDLFLVPIIPIRDDAVEFVKVMIRTVTDIFKLPVVRADVEFEVWDGASLAKVNQGALEVIFIPDVPDLDTKPVDVRKILHHLWNHVRSKIRARLDVLFDNSSDGFVFLRVPAPLLDEKPLGNQFFVLVIDEDVPVRFHGQIFATSLIEMSIGSTFAVEGITVVEGYFGIYRGKLGTAKRPKFAEREI